MMICYSDFSTMTTWQIIVYLAQFGELVSEFRKSRNNPKITKNDAVVRTFFKAIDLWPHINPSDI